MSLALSKSTLIVAACIAMVGCETTAGTAGLQCGAVGAAVAVLACKMNKKNSNAKCAAIAALAAGGGGAICYAYASNLEKRRKELSGHENDLDARIKYVRGLNEDSARLNAELNQRVETAKRSSDELAGQINQQQITGEQLAQLRQSRAKELQSANEQVASGTAALAELKTYRARATATSPAFDADLARLEQANADSRRLVAQLAVQNRRV